MRSKVFLFSLALETGTYCWQPPLELLNNRNNIIIHRISKQYLPQKQSTICLKTCLNLLQTNPSSPHLLEILRGEQSKNPNFENQPKQPNFLFQNVCINYPSTNSDRMHLETNQCREIYLVCCDNCFDVLKPERRRKEKSHKKAKENQQQTKHWDCKGKEKSRIHLQIENNSSFSSKNGRRIWQERIKNAQISGMNMHAAHDDILVHIQNCTLPIVIHQNPTTNGSLLLRSQLNIPGNDKPVSTHYQKFKPHLWYIKTNTTSTWTYMAKGNGNQRISAVWWSGVVKNSHGLGLSRVVVWEKGDLRFWRVREKGEGIFTVLEGEGKWKALVKAWRLWDICMA